MAEPVSLEPPAWTEHLRPHDWPERLDAYLAAAAGRSVDWCEWDCVRFAAGAVVALTGRDPLAALGGLWRDEASARQLLAELGGLEAAVTRILGRPYPLPTLARRGDVVLVEAVASEPVLGVAHVGRAAILAERGIAYVRAQRIASSWPVGWPPMEIG